MNITMLRQILRGGALALALWVLTGCGSDEQTTAPDKLDPIDEIAPLAPTGLVARQNQNGFGAGWEANTEADLQGYHVYVLGADSFAPDVWLRVTKTPITSRGFAWKDPSGELAQFVIRVSAIDEVGNESVWSPAVSAQNLVTPKHTVELGPNSGDAGGSGGSGGSDGEPSHGGEPVEHGGR